MNARTPEMIAQREEARQRIKGDGVTDDKDAINNYLLLQAEFESESRSLDP